MRRPAISAQTDSVEVRELFLEEEFRGDRLVNNVRFYILFVLLAFALMKNGFPRALHFDAALNFTLIILGVGYLYTGALYFLYRRHVYRRALKYVSMTLDVTLAVLATASYRLEAYEEYATIFMLARASIVYWFIIWSLLRYNVWLSLYSGLLAAAEYLLFVVVGNDLLGRPFSFTGKDGLIHVGHFASSEEILKIVYLAAGGVLAMIVAIRLRHLVVDSMRREHDKSRLQAQNQLITTVNQENRKYLDNVREGLLLIDAQYRIGDQYSRFLTELFGTEEVAGRSFVDFMYPDAAMQGAERAELERFLSIVFSNTTASLAMIMSVNPLSNKTILIKDAVGEVKKRVVDASFHRIGNSAAVDSVMVVFEDRTAVTLAQKELEQEKQSHEAEMESISAILKAGPQALKDFVEESRQGLLSVMQAIPNLAERSTLNQAFREIHSVKGSAGMMGFRRIAADAHAAEGLLANVRDRDLPADEALKSSVEQAVKLVFSDFDAVQKLYNSFTEFTSRPLEGAAGGTGSSLDRFLDSLRQMTADLSVRVQKEITFHAQNGVGDLPFLAKVKNPLIHMIRNAVDHGVEDPFERLSKGKPKEGNIRLGVSRDGDSYIIEVADDGAGIDFDRVRTKGIQKKLIAEGEEDVSNRRLLNLLFMPGFSSRDDVTEISGMGVGLDVVKDAVTALGGKISVATERDKGTRLSLRIPG